MDWDRGLISGWVVRCESNLRMGEVMEDRKGEDQEKRLGAGAVRSVWARTSEAKR